MKSDRVHYIIFSCLGLVYLLLPTQNANIDSWYYAACVKHGQELFHSHHLLYNVFGRYWYLLLRVFNPDIEAIAALNMMNAIAATGSLFICYRIFLQLELNNRQAFWLTLLCGSCFGFMRFATDAETYILPFLCSLASTYYFLKRQDEYLLIASFFAVLAILIHQLHICWALAMVITLVKRKPQHPKSLLVFLLPFILIPAIYYIVWKAYDPFHSYWAFLSGEYSKGNAGFDLSLTSLMLTGINFIRSFVQVHGQIVAIISANLFFGILPLLVVLVATIYIIVNRPLRIKIHKNSGSNRAYKILFFWAFLLHLVFAFLSSGNAEFMIMIPFLFLALLYVTFDFSVSKILPFIAIGVFTWNYCLAILPKHIYDIDRVDHQAEFTLKHPEAHFLWKHRPLVENVLTYRQGFGRPYNFIRLDDTTQRIVDSLVRHKLPVYTDYTNPSTDFSREEMLTRTSTSYLNGRYYFLSVEAWSGLYSINRSNEINLITKKGD